jgi:hypothetical protein
MKRVNLEDGADFIGNRPPKPAGVQLIRRFDQRRPMIDIEEGEVEAEEEQRRKAILEEKERSRAEHQAKVAAAAPAPAPKPAKTNPELGIMFHCSQYPNSKARCSRATFHPFG